MTESQDDDGEAAGSGGSPSAPFSPDSIGSNTVGVASAIDQTSRSAPRARSPLVSPLSTQPTSSGLTQSARSSALPSPEVSSPGQTPQIRTTASNTVPELSGENMTSIPAELQSDQIREPINRSSHATPSPHSLVRNDNRDDTDQVMRPNLESSEGIEGNSHQRRHVTSWQSFDDQTGPVR